MLIAIVTCICFQLRHLKFKSSITCCKLLSLTTTKKTKQKKKHTLNKCINFISILLYNKNKKKVSQIYFINYVKYVNMI